MELGCSDTSNAATLTVNCALSITLQPVDQTVNVAADAHFIAEASSPTATFQWQEDSGTGFADLSNGGQYSGAASDTLTISNVALSQDSSHYRCIVTESGCSDTSDVVLLAVNNNTGIKELINENGISIYPNPANERVTLQVTLVLIGSSYRILNETGTLILNGRLNNKETSIDINHLAAGIYFIEIGSGNTKYKLVKQ